MPHKTQHNATLSTLNQHYQLNQMQHYISTLSNISKIIPRGEENLGCEWKKGWNGLEWKKDENLEWCGTNKRDYHLDSNEKKRTPGVAVLGKSEEGSCEKSLWKC